ncbi:hypothetical protein [Alloyangia pacifica]|uniref:hypothetical protein n=1 Tax=Alloyangia pacifica TaxID=311180 RepID=UPI0031D0070C
MTLILNVGTALSAPALYLPDLGDDLLLDFDPDGLVGSLSNGDVVTSWQAGAGSLVNEEIGTFDTISGAVNFRSAGGPGGAPMVELGSDGRIKTFSGSYYPGFLAGPSSATFSMLVRVTDPDAFVNSGAHRVLYCAPISGESPFMVVRPSGSDRFYYGTNTGSANGGAAPDPTGWGILTVSLEDGVQYQWKNQTEDLVTTSVGATGDTLHGLVMGYQTGALPSVDYLGLEIARLRVWGRALRANEIAAQHELWTDQYGL